MPDGAVSLYRNGVLIATGTTAVPNNVNRSSNYIGRSNFGDPYYDGSLADLTIWNVPLTQAQVQQQMFDAPPENASGLVASYPLDDGNGDLARDQSGHGFDGSLGNGVSTAMPVWAALAASVVDVEGGTLSGVGTISANVINAAQVSPGSSPGILAVKGNYTQTATGSLNIQIGGDTPGAGYDQIASSGSTVLGGTLNVSLINGFGPRSGQVFNILTFANSSGNFSTVNLPQLGGQPAFITQTAPTAYHLVGATTASDLTVLDVAVPSLGTPGQDGTISYRVTNNGTVAATGSWIDSVYLSSDGNLSPDDILLGRVSHSGDLAYGEIYQGSLTTPLPGLTDGTYRILVVVDSGLQVPDINRTNNIVTALAPLPVRVPLLDIGSSVGGSIAAGQDLYYKVNVPPGASVQLAADFAVSLESEILVSFGVMPTRSTFDISANDPTSLNQIVLLPAGQAGPYYVLLHGRPGADTGKSFTLRAELAPFEITQFDPSSGGNQGQRTVNITGAGFSSNTMVSLHNAVGSLEPYSVIFVDANHLTAKFDLLGVEAGKYMLEADDGVQTAVAKSLFEVTATADVPLLKTILIVPDQVSVGAAIVAHFTITNYGQNDVLLPLYQITGGDTVPQQTTVDSILLGGRRSTSFGAIFKPKPSGNHHIHGFGVNTLPPGSMIDWSVVEEANRPPTIPPDVWHTIWTNATAAIGSTADELQATLEADASYFAQLGTPITDTQTLIAFEIQKATAAAPIPTLGSAVDVAFAEPGLPLTFARTFSQSIVGRNHVGNLGYGWVSNWDVSAGIDNTTGNIFITEGALKREFVLQKDGTYQGVGADHAALTFSSGILTLRELDGTVTSFLEDGRLDYVADPNGNRITAGYTDNRLTSLSHSNGDQLLFTYNPQGRLASVTDPAGRTATYSYDAAGEHLLVASVPRGIYAYSYVTGQGTAEENALALATYPDGSHLANTYDIHGRLTGMDDGSNPVTFAYLSPGGYTITDGSGATSQVLIDITGQPAAIKDALGNLRKITYDNNGQPVLSVAPDGAAAKTSYDNNGNAAGLVDPLGNSVRANYDPQFNGLQTFQDPLGATTNFTYDSQGNMQSIVYADGTGMQFATDFQGLVEQAVNGRGQAIHYTYDSRGHVLTAQYPNGTTVFTYDTRGNLHTASDASGTTTMDYDGG